MKMSNGKMCVEEIRRTQNLGKGDACWVNDVVISRDEIMALFHWEDKSDNKGFILKRFNLNLEELCCEEAPQIEDWLVNEDFHPTSFAFDDKMLYFIGRRGAFAREGSLLKQANGFFVFHEALTSFERKTGKAVKSSVGKERQDFEKIAISDNNIYIREDDDTCTGETLVLRKDEEGEYNLLYMLSYLEKDKMFELNMAGKPAILKVSYNESKNKRKGCCMEGYVQAAQLINGKKEFLSGKVYRIPNVDPSTKFFLDNNFKIVATHCDVYYDCSYFFDKEGKIVQKGRISSLLWEKIHIMLPNNVFIVSGCRDMDIYPSEDMGSYPKDAYLSKIQIRREK